jgi:2-polyprenyl-3-methyl-5-hydroxy-6-metoxy-1,4-benzoquinol methylase
LSSYLRCPLCGGAATNSAPYPSRNQSPSTLHFESITECGTCGLGTAQPRPSQRALDAFYASGAYWHASTGSRAQLAHERNQGRHRVLRCLSHFMAGGAVADIGAGHGAIAEWLDRLAGNRVLRYDFIEPDATSRQWILSRSVRFPLLAAPTIADLGHDYTLVFLDHVLEHVADPVDFLGAVCARLQVGGVAYIETPHADYRFKEDVFPHTLFFTPSALRHLVLRLGLEVIECESFGAYPGTPGGMHPGIFRRVNVLYHLATHGAPAVVTQVIDDAIWRYQPVENGMWLRCIVRRLR